MIHIDNISKIYNQRKREVTALSEISFALDDLESLVIMGKSGSGKSTLLHLIAGLERATSGRIFLGRREITALKDRELTLLRREKIGIVFQLFNLLENLTVAENIALPLILARKTSDCIKREAERVMELVQLRDRADHRIGELSGGEMQRVAIGRAIIKKPEIILADEPTGNLDSKTGKEILSLISHLITEIGSSLIIVTHDQDATSLCEKQMILKDGRQVGI
ncbi:MAG: ABC transporter ATP-binding protein [Thermodesulfobacteriota bacterium]|nr:ABC transporter ATP-binding protein [Thermodesulfobacteriota bacterium]